MKFKGIKTLKSAKRSKKNRSLSCSNITFEDIIPQLTSIDFPSYLGKHTTLILSYVSKSCHNLVHKYICDNYIFYLSNKLLKNGIRIYLEMHKVLIQENLTRWPMQVTHLLIGDQYNTPVSNLPNTISHLETGHLFNQPIYSFPSFLTHLKLGNSFNQPLYNLPSTLTHLDIGDKFYRNVESLPEKITHLSIGWGFYMPFHNLPSRLVSLKIKDPRQIVETQQRNSRRRHNTLTRALATVIAVFS